MRLYPSFTLLFVAALWLSSCERDPDGRRNMIEGLIERGSVAELTGAIMSRRISVEALTRAYLDRIAAFDDKTRAVLAINPDAISDARRKDEYLQQAPASLPALFGIPVLVKDNIETREMPTTAGSLALASNDTGRDAPLIERLRASGAIILGKTNLSEWANFRSSRSSSGWSGVGGQTRNPFDLSRSPCGSSSGSGVAVAARYAPLAIGTETNGSIVCPAGVNGVVGIKPTVGLVPADRIVPISHSQDTAGPMALDVESAALLLEALSGTKGLVPAPGSSIENKRIGIVRSAAGYHEGVDALLAAAIGTLERGGAIIIDDLELKPAYKGLRDDTLNILLYEFKHDLNQYLASLPGKNAPRSLEELIAFNIAHADEEMPWFRQETFTRAQAKGGLDNEEYRSAMERAGRATREDGIDQLLADHHLDALIAPTGGPAWTIDLVNGDHGLGGFSTYPAVAGYPHVTVPMGDVAGLPVGLSFTAGRNQDARVIALAREYERLRPKPVPVPSLDGPGPN
ncbi:MAG: amidase [Pseudomonadales bacterium]|nr:amidase [Pseudomonadales bacterium]